MSELKYNKQFDRFMSERISEILSEEPLHRVKMYFDQQDRILQSFSPEERKKLEALIDHAAELSAQENRSVYLGGLSDGLYLRFLTGNGGI